MLSLDKSGWDKFMKAWENVVEVFPDAKRRALHEAGKVVLMEVMDQIVITGVRDTRFNVRNWQSTRMGSGGGYVAISPAVVSVPGKGMMSKKITEYLDQGHAARRPTGRNKRYKPQIKRAMIGAAGNVFVPGRHFYSAARPKANTEAKKAAEKVLAQIENLLYDQGYDV